MLDRFSTWSLYFKCNKWRELSFAIVGLRDINAASMFVLLGERFIPIKIEVFGDYWVFTKFQL